MQQTGWTCRAWEEAEVITDDDDEKDSASNKKRRIDNGHDRSNDEVVQKEELSSVMSKTERVPAFSFSFL